MASRLPLELEEELAALRDEVACKLYEKDIFSLGRAAEWAGLSIEEIKESLHRKGIARHTSDPAEMEAMVCKSLEAARRADR